MVAKTSGWVSIAMVALAGCGDASTEDERQPSPSPCTSDAECGGSTPLCDPEAGVCAALPPGWEIGLGDGSPSSVVLTEILVQDELREPTDLQFNPSKPTELWIVNRKDDSAIIVQNPGTPEMTWERRRDPAASHFMASPPALAFGIVIPEWGQTFAVCGDDDNSANGFLDFMGPALFTANLDIFAKQTPMGLGSHLDMLHSTSFCRGIAHVADNRYVVFNSDERSIDMYDFKADHGPGNDDHSDGEILRYAAGAVAGKDGVPSHLVVNPADGWIYVADTGNARIAKLDPNSGKMGAPFSGDEPVVVRNLVEGATIADFVPPGILEGPSGIEVKGDLVYVSDAATSRFHAFDRDGKEVRRLDTGLPPGTLAGFTFGPDGKVWFVDVVASKVFRIDPR